MVSGLELADAEEIYIMPNALDLLKMSPGPCSPQLGAYLEHGVRYVEESLNGTLDQCPWCLLNRDQGLGLFKESARKWKGARGQVVVVVVDPRRLRAVSETKHQHSYRSMSYLPSDTGVNSTSRRLPPSLCHLHPYMLHPIVGRPDLSRVHVRFQPRLVMSRLQVEVGPSPFLINAPSSG